MNEIGSIFIPRAPFVLIQKFTVALTLQVKGDGFVFVTSLSCLVENRIQVMINSVC